LRPFIFDGRGQSFRGIEFAAPCSIHSDKIRVAELTNRRSSIGFAARPEIAAGETAEDRGTTSLRTLALQRIEDFLDGVAHD